MKSILLVLVAVAVAVIFGVGIYAASASSGWLGQNPTFFGMPMMWNNNNPTSANSYPSMMNRYWSNYTYGSQMMTKNVSYAWMMQNYGSLMSASAITRIQLSHASQLMKVIPNDATVFASNDTIKFSQNSMNVSIIAYMMGGDLAKNLTGAKELPSYSSDNVFVIYGLINPTITVPKGSSAHFLVINLDDSDYHNLDLTTASPPYSYMPMMSGSNGMMGSSAGGRMMNGYGNNNGRYPSMMPMITPANYSQGFAYSYSYSLALSTPGTLWYFCMYPGHAQSGMYGKILVVG
jgi:rusticyanin